MPQPSQDIKCKGDMSEMDDVPFPGGRPRPGDCVLGTVDFKGPDCRRTRRRTSGSTGSPAP
ncbi:hypothetical protein MAHJHV63_50520 [Mycobacterium avium subsp. hominissuis]